MTPLQLLRRYAAFVDPRITEIIFLGGIVGPLGLGLAGRGAQGLSFPIISDGILVVSGVLLSLTVLTMIICMVFAPESETALHCARCGGEGYLINVGLRILEDCPYCAKAESLGTTVAGSPRQRHSGLAERALLVKG